MRSEFSVLKVEDIVRSVNSGVEVGDSVLCKDDGSATKGVLFDAVELVAAFSVAVKFL